MSGVKFDEGKPSVSLIPPTAILEEAKVMGYGAGKYGRNNWLKGMAWSRLASAAFRHLLAWELGEENDQETGISHLAHVRCCVAMLMWYQEKSLGTDDRINSNKCAEQ